MRLFTLATISSRIAASEGTEGARRAVRMARAVAGTRRARDADLVPVLTGILEGEDGAIDMDLRVFLQVGDVALERLLPLLAVQLQLQAVLHLGEVRVHRLHLAHQLENQVPAGV